MATPSVAQSIALSPAIQKNYDDAMAAYASAPKPALPLTVPALELDQFDISKVTKTKTGYTLTGSLNQVMEGGGPHTYAVSIKIGDSGIRCATAPCPTTTLSVKLDKKAYSLNLSDLANLDKAIEARLTDDVMAHHDFPTGSVQEKELNAERDNLPAIVSEVSSLLSYRSQVARETR